MRRRIIVKGKCPVSGKEKSIYVNYLYAGTQTCGSVWTKGTFDCRENCLIGNQPCQTCPIFNEAPQQIQD